ncbi:hypothetical protein ANN_12149 [Periplaneta americana]|uniref:Uncharacterized protein n=1 Tax=Periplaneta americana TaxID=6978 RepID=A0ABQ8T8V1_PERAM|nr:hypothetical protein ANN_12149 [Periplaneta americana]
MADLCEGGNEPSGSLKAIKSRSHTIIHDGNINITANILGNHGNITTTPFPHILSYTSALQDCVLFASHERTYAVYIVKCPQLSRKSGNSVRSFRYRPSLLLGSSPCDRQLHCSSKLNNASFSRQLLLKAGSQSTGNENRNENENGLVRCGDILKNKRVSMTHNTLSTTTVTTEHIAMHNLPVTAIAHFSEC